MNKNAFRLLFGLTVLTLPVQVAVRHFASEPYPGLYLPSFGGVPQRGEFAITEEPRIEARFADGTHQELQISDVLPPVSSLPSAIFRSAFIASPERAQHPQTRAMVAARVEATTGRRPTSVLIEWQQVQYDTRDGSRRPVEVLRSVQLDLREDA